jgi:hypothetical protein
MAIEVQNGFDTNIYNTPDIEWDSGSSWFPISPGRFGGSAARGHPFLGVLSLQKSLGQVRERYFGNAFYINPNYGYQPHPLFQWRDQVYSTTHCWVGYSNIGQLYFQGPSGVLSTTLPYFLRLGAWYYIEGYAKIGSADGAFEIRIGGATILLGSGCNTQSTVNNYTDGFQINYNIPGGYVYAVGDPYYIDDLYVLNTSGPKNNTFLGEQKIITSDLNSDYSIQFSRNSGSSNYGQLITDDGDTTTTSGDTIGNRDLFGITPLTVTPNNYGEWYWGNDITSTKMVVIARKDDVGYRNIGLTIDSSSTINVFPFNVINAGYILSYIIPLLGTYECSYQIFENDPNTNTIWTEIGVNAVKIGYDLIG